jgi:hypothetical protein
MRNKLIPKRALGGPTSNLGDYTSPKKKGNSLYD